MSAEREFPERAYIYSERNGSLAVDTQPAQLDTDPPDVEYIRADVATLLAQPERKPQWSDQPPTLPGWYWHRYSSSEPTLAQVFWSQRKSYLAFRYPEESDDETYAVSGTGGQWAGPITPPEE